MESKEFIRDAACLNLIITKNDFQVFENENGRYLDDVSTSVTWKAGKRIKFTEVRVPLKYLWTELKDDKELGDGLQCVKQSIEDVLIRLQDVSFAAAKTLLESLFHRIANLPTPVKILAWRTDMTSEITIDKRLRVQKCMMAVLNIKDDSHTADTMELFSEQLHLVLRKLKAYEIASLEDARERKRVKHDRDNSISSNSSDGFDIKTKRTPPPAPADVKPSPPPPPAHIVSKDSPKVPPASTQPSREETWFKCTNCHSWCVKDVGCDSCTPVHCDKHPMVQILAGTCVMCLQDAKTKKEKYDAWLRGLKEAMHGSDEEMETEKQSDSESWSE